MLPLRVGQAERIKGDELLVDTIEKRGGLENPGYPILFYGGFIPEQ